MPLGSTPSLIPELDPLITSQSERAKSLTKAAWAIANTPLQEQSKYASRDPRTSMANSISFGADGFASNVPRSLIGTESGGNWQAMNNETGAGGKAGHFGILQFGHARLEDAKRAGVIPAGMTAEQFRRSKPAQVAASNWHFAEIDNNIRKAGFDRLVGQTVGDVPISMNGMRAMAHLGGFGGLSSFIGSGGKYNPADSYGTSLSSYGKRHYQ